MNTLVILGNQLFAQSYLPPPSSTQVFMAEDLGLCTYERHHQQKIVLFLAAMRAYADELRAAGYDVLYEQLDTNDNRTYEDKLAAALEAGRCRQLLHFEIEDKPMERRLVTFATEHKLERVELASPMFLVSRDEFSDYAKGKSRLLMGDFYKRQRRKLDLLVETDGSPVGGQWSFDAENRKKLPKQITPPAIPRIQRDKHVDDIVAVVERAFPDHPGDASEFAWPTTRAQALEWLDDFVANRLAQFGPYEDAMSTRSSTVFHSLLSPLLNLGLLTPREVIDRVMADPEEAPLQSIEGFARIRASR